MAHVLRCMREEGKLDENQITLWWMDCEARKSVMTDEGSRVRVLCCLYTYAAVGHMVTVEMNGWEWYVEKLGE